MRPGIDIFLEKPTATGSGCALICSASSVDSRGRPVFRLLHNHLATKLKCIGSLQHGFFNDKQDNMLFSDSFVHPELNIPVFSLYSERLSPPEEWLEGIDTLIVDIQDVGTRVYTFTNHLVRIARSLSGKTIRWIVLDRPNPLGGSDLEGPILEPDYRSIVGEITAPMRHGLSAAEYLKTAVTEENLDIDLTVIPVEGWTRRTHLHGIWTMPSPNMPTSITAHIYPGAVLLEGTNISEGRGTTRPFELIGAPFINGYELASHMNQTETFGITSVPIHFKPEFSKYQGEMCNGILCHQPDPVQTRSFAFFYELIRWIRRNYPGDFTWKLPPYEFEYQRFPIDMICGGPSFRLAVERDIPLQDWLRDSETGFGEYRERVAGNLMY